MAFNVQIKGIEKLVRVGAGLRESRKKTLDLLMKVSEDFANAAVSTVKKDYLTGPRPQKLGVVTGRLRSSIRSLITGRGEQITVRFGTDVPYAAIHEFGGKTAPHVITPKKGGILAFVKGGRLVFARSVNHPGSTIKARPFLTPGVEDELPRFQTQIEQMLERVATEGISG